MKWALYNLAFSLVFPFLLPGFLLRMLKRGGYAARMGDRFGVYPRGEVEFADGMVWIHAVSVGEVQVALQFMREWRRAEPAVRFCFSTTSSTGWKIASAGVSDADTLIYNPLDFPNFVKSALLSVKPRAIVLTESEIWPVFIRRAARYGVPLFLINARVSDRSAPRYKAARWFFKDVFRCFSRIFAQSRLDAERLVAAGADEDSVCVTGSFKFDVAHRNPAKEKELADWIASFAGNAAPHRIMLGASTWPGEDEVLLEICKSLPPDVLPVIAPRHFEKADAVEDNIRRAGFRCIRRSRSAQASACDAQEGGRLAFLADTTGELMGLYGIADVVFVGKSLCEHGSQNMIEPCLCGKPTVVGPYTENFRPVMSDLRDASAIVQVAGKAELAETIARWFSPEGAHEAAELGKRAQAAVAARVGVVPKCVAEVRAALAGRENPFARLAASHGRKKRSIAVWLAPIAIFALCAAAVFVRFTRVSRGLEQEKAAEQFRYKPIDTVTKFIGRVEKPDAAASNDIVHVSGRARPKWENAIASASPDAAIVWSLDVKDMSLADFRRALESFPCPDAHLWMPSETEWVLSGRLKPASVALGDMLEVFASDESIDELADANCDSLPELFANYAGDRRTCAGAFRGNLAANVRPEYFVTQDIPDVGWISPGDLDEDILEMSAQEMRSMMLVRRNVIEGNMLARDGKTDDAIEKWAAAILRNPHDTMLLARIHTLAVNAVTFENVGNIKAAAKCYETMLCIRPRDIAAVTAYANCLRRLGKNKMADDVMQRVRALKASMRDAQPDGRKGDEPQKNENAKP